MTVSSATTSGNSRGSAFALGGLLTLVLGCCVAGGILAVLREEGAAGIAEPQGGAVDAARDEPASVDGPFHYAAVRRTREERPARFDAALPAGPQGFVEGWTDAHPPLGYVRDLVCAGDPAMGERWLAAIAGGSAEGSPGDSRAYVQMFGECVSAGLCSWVQEVLGSGRAPASLRPVWTLAARCDDSATRALFRDRDVPPEAYLAWTEHHVVWDVQGGRLSAEVDVAKLAAAIETLAAGDEPTPEGAPMIPALLGMADDPRAAGTLLRMHAATRNEEKRHELAMAMHLQRDRRARRIFDAECATHAPTDPFCSTPAASLPAASAEPPPAAVPVEPATFSRLRALGLLGTPKPGGAIAETTMELLEHSGRALVVELLDVECDSSARQLAALATPVLDDVLFEAHLSFDGGDGGERNALIAWSRGERFEALVAPAHDEDEEDIKATVGVLNVLARSRGSSVRFVLSESDEAPHFVVAGLEHSLRAAIAEGLIHVWPSAAPTADAPGEAFLRALRGEPVD